MIMLPAPPSPFLIALRFWCQITVCKCKLLFAVLPSEQWMKMLLDLTPKNRLIRSQLCTVVTGKDGMCHLAVSRVGLLLYLLRRLDNRRIVCNPKAQQNDYVFFKKKSVVFTNNSRDEQVQYRAPTASSLHCSRGSSSPSFSVWTCF